MTDSDSPRPAAAPLESGADGLVFDCPRCARHVTERFYGPCRPCRAALLLAFAGEGRTVETTRFEPPLHVTPNAVATKD